MRTSLRQGGNPHSTQLPKTGRREPQGHGQTAWQRAWDASRPWPTCGWGCKSRAPEPVCGHSFLHGRTGPDELIVVIVATAPIPCPFAGLSFQAMNGVGGGVSSQGGGVHGLSLEGFGPGMGEASTLFAGLGHECMPLCVRPDPVSIDAEGFLVFGEFHQLVNTPFTSFETLPCVDSLKPVDHGFPFCQVGLLFDTFGNSLQASLGERPEEMVDLSSVSLLHSHSS